MFYFSGITQIYCFQDNINWVHPVQSMGDSSCGVWFIKIILFSMYKVETNYLSQLLRIIVQNHSDKFIFESKKLQCCCVKTEQNPVILTVMKIKPTIK